MDKLDRISCVAWLFISVFVWITAMHLGVGTFRNPGPGFILFWASIFLAFFTSILFGVSLFKKKDAVHPADLWKGLDWGKNIIVVAALIGYCLTLQKLGYLVATLGLMLVLFSLGKMKLWTIILGSLITVLLSYSLFGYFLQTPLPRGILSF